MHLLFTDFNKAYDLVEMEISYNTLEFGISTKLVRLIKICSQKAYSEVWIGKGLSDTFPI